MSLPVAKVAIGLGVTGGVTGLGYLSVSYLFPNEDKRITVSKLFEEQGRTLLIKGSDTDQGNSRGSEYVKENKNAGQLEDYESQKGNTGTATTSFIEKCVSNSEAKVSGIEDPLYLEIVKYCSKEFSIEHFVGKDSKIAILETSSGTDATGWNAAGKNYLEDNGSNNPGTVNGGVNAKQPTDHPSDFRTKCGSKKGDKVFWTKDPKFVNFTRWCTKSTGV